MLVLFDHVTPNGIARFLLGHMVTKAKDRGWDTLTNGDLLAEAERAGFDVLLTADKNMRYQQNLSGRRIGLVVLSTPQWPAVRLHIERIAAAVDAATPGSYTEVARFTSPDKPFTDQDPSDPQSWNLYSYARNNPLKFVDDTGEAVVYADERLKIISEARRQESPTYNSYLKGFEGKGSPDVTVQYGSTANDPDGSPTNGATHAIIAPAVQTCSSATDCAVSSPAALKSATITVNDKLANDTNQTSDTLAHEASHANDARTSPERYGNEKITDANGKVIPHDSRPVEQRAIAGATQSNREVSGFKKQDKEKYKQIEQQKKEQLKQERKRHKENEGN